MQLNDVRYSWALGLYQQMRENFWIPQKLDLTQDVTDYWNLTTEERHAYDGILSYLTFLDSVQMYSFPPGVRIYYSMFSPPLFIWVTRIFVLVSPSFSLSNLSLV